MHKTKPLALIVLIILLFPISSCNNDNYFTIGSSWVDSDFSVLTIDTMTVKLTTVAIDSLSTKDKSVILVGRYNDVDHYTNASITGITTAESYIEIDRPLSISIDRRAVFDSMVLEMRFNGKYFGDTLSPQNINVHRLTQKMTLPEDYYEFFNTTVFDYDPTPLAGGTFATLPVMNANAGSESPAGALIPPASIRFPDETGKEFFDKMLSNSDEFDSDVKFKEYFKGIVLTPGDDSKAITGFKIDSTFKIRMYYHIKEEIKNEFYIDFTAKPEQQFNNIRTDRQNTPLAGFTNRIKELPSEQTDNCAYLQSGDGLYAKLEFPYLSSLNWIRKYGTIHKATLIIRPVLTTYNYRTPLPDALSLISVNQVGVGTEIKDDRDLAQTGDLYIDDQFRENNNYSFDITTFLNSQVNLLEGQSSYLTLRIPSTDMQNSIMRLVFGNNKQTTLINGKPYTSRIELKIYYASYN